MPPVRPPLSRPRTASASSSSDSQSKATSLSRQSSGSDSSLGKESLDHQEQLAYHQAPGGKAGAKGLGRPGSLMKVLKSPLKSLQAQKKVRKEQRALRAEAAAEQAFLHLALDERIASIASPLIAAIEARGASVPTAFHLYPAGVYSERKGQLPLIDDNPRLMCHVIAEVAEALLGSMEDHSAHLWRPPIDELRQRTPLSAKDLTDLRAARLELVIKDRLLERHRLDT